MTATKQKTAKPGTKASRIAALGRKLQAFTWDIDEDARDFVATVAGTDYRLPVVFAFRDMNTFKLAVEAEPDREPEALRALIDTVGRGEDYDKLTELSVYAYNAVITTYVKTLNEIAEATPGES